MNLTHHTEILPSAHPVYGPGRPAGLAHALEELDECRELLRVPSELLRSPRMRRRYQEALDAVASYTTDTEENAA